MAYFTRVQQEMNRLVAWAELRHEQGADGGRVARKMGQLARHLAALRRQMEQARPKPSLLADEPDGLEAIRALRPAGPRQLWSRFDPAVYAEKVRGAWLARCAGCTLGAIVEQWPVEAMEQLAAHSRLDFPPTDYWTVAGQPHHLRYGLSRCDDYTRRRLRHVPVDDDTNYTLLGLLILEEFGPDFTTEQVGRAWTRYLPIAYTAEKVTLENLQAGLPWQRAGEKDNPYVEWIGADIRADPWAYAAPGWPEKAAELAWRDARLSHRRNGIYGEMFFAAAISAAFAVDDPLEACRLGLTEIPRRSRLYKEVSWALRVAPQIKDWREARRRVDRRFPGMHAVHTINNACLTVFGLALGRSDVTRTLGLTVAMGLDNDCTAATAGSILGALVGAKGVPGHWWKPFRGRARSYLKGREWFGIDDTVRRFTRQAKAVWSARP
jgi:ADP-ribosylglycohydrolase